MRNARKIAAVLSMGMALSAVCGMNAFAADQAFKLDVENWTEQDWNCIAMTNDDTVTSGAIIRSAASTDADVVGYLYRGAAVEVLDKGDTWTEIESGAVTGYVMNDYLVYGDDAKGLAEYYGKEGVVANWNDVNIFTDKSAASVSKTVEDGTALPLVSDEGHWLLVQQGADSAGYVSSEDASRMLLVDTAVPADGNDVVSTYNENLGGTASAAADSASEQGDADTSSEESSSDTGADQAAQASSESSSWTDSSSGSSDGSSDSTYTDRSYTDSTASADSSSYDTGSSGDTSSADTSSSEAASSSETYTTQNVSDDANVQALYDAYIAAQNAAMNCTSEQDAKDKALAAVQAYNAYVAAANGAGTTASSSDAGQADTSASDSSTSETTSETTAQTEAPQTEAPQTEAPQTEAAQSTSSSSSSGSTGSYADYSDLDLLAAIIWCEAGNQPYDGMVAVGEVVMNRVASSSFPNTIAEVLEQPGQFTPYASGTLQSALASGVNSTCYQAAQDALNGAQPVPGALYFNTHSGTTKLGDHYFS